MNEWMYTYTLPWPPTTNTYYRFTGGRPKLSKTGRAYRQLTAMKIRTQGRPVDPIQGPAHVKLTLHPPDDRRRDADNYLKALLDTLVTSGVLADDCRGQIEQITVTWADRRHSDGGRVRVTITPYLGTPV